MKGLVAAVLLGLSSFQASLSHASGQTVLVRVSAAESGAAIAGAFVSLLDARGTVLRSALTDASGRSLLRVEEPGVVRVQAEMIGRETTRSEPVTARPGQAARVDLVLRRNAVPLDAIRVEADERCRIRPVEATDIARVWEEARKALAMQAWTEAETRYLLQITTWDRDLDSAGRRVEREDRRAATTVTRVPFESLPVEDLATGGYVRRQDDGGYRYFGPDADVLLSDRFLETHCFRLRRSRDHPGSVGLAFEPVSGIDLPDIRGTFWLDAETARLQFLEFLFTRTPFPEAQGIAGGRVEFEAMPDGAWIIDRWWIRAPILAQQFGQGRLGSLGIRVDAIRESGGEVLGASTLDRQVIDAATSATLTGVVWDSTRDAPLEAAVVTLAGTAYRAVTDADGRFRIDGLPDGVFVAGFEHPRLDSLPSRPPEPEVELERGEIAELRLAVPSMTTIMLAACGQAGPDDNAAVLSGFVRDRAHRTPVPGATVRVSWQAVIRVYPYIETADRFIEARSDADGHYIACGLPTDELLEVRAGLAALQAVAIETRFPEKGHRALDLEVDVLPRVGAVTVQGGGTGGQGVQGTLLDRTSGDPIRSAEVFLAGEVGRRTTSISGETNAQGFFRLRTPASGTFRFSAQALGYADLEEREVEVADGRLSVLEIRMTPEALELEPLVVTAEPRRFSLEMAGFYKRRAEGGRGVFVTPEEIEIRQPRRVIDLLEGIPGTREVTVPGGRALYFSEGTSIEKGVCWPMVWVDRILISSGGDMYADVLALYNAVSATDVEAIEVYRSAIVPFEFSGPNASCGVVVIWTHRGR